MALTITADTDAAKQWKENFEGTARDFDQAMKTAANMAASLIQAEVRGDISRAGNFGGDWLDAVQVETEDTSGGDMRITLTLDKPGATVFENGGTIQGHPLLWLPLSSTGRIPARDYPDQLFSVNVAGKPPLLFSVADHLPKYFGVPSVTIPKKFHIREICLSTMASFHTLLASQLKVR